MENYTETAVIVSHRIVIIGLILISLPIIMMYNLLTFYWDFVFDVNFQYFWKLISKIIVLIIFE